MGKCTDFKFERLRTQFRIHCANCGHSMVVFDTKPDFGKKICTQCGVMNYSKKESFRRNMMKELKK